MKSVWVCLWTTAIVFLYDATLPAESKRFTKDTRVTHKPVVKDAKTGLIWQGCTAGQTGDNCATNSAQIMTWQDALAYCANLKWGDDDAGYWRLPSVVELSSIVDDRECSPSIDADAFPATMSDGYWSSSSNAYYEVHAWYVNFNYGDVDSDGKDDNYYARCVRSGP
ncbi:MAG: DUF1566 domain-containing protein [Deltaproteobacteria bacterium]|nr:DUF1566 domain-containing protein [Deltaproteobacteria bacterium]